TFAIDEPTPNSIGAPQLGQLPCATAIDGSGATLSGYERGVISASSAPSWLVGPLQCGDTPPGLDAGTPRPPAHSCCWRRPLKPSASSGPRQLSLEARPQRDPPRVSTVSSGFARFWPDRLRAPRDRRRFSS